MNEVLRRRGIDIYFTMFICASVVCRVHVLFFLTVCITETKVQSNSD